MIAYKIDHVGVAVSSIDNALEIYEALGIAEAKREVVPGQKVTVAWALARTRQPGNSSAGRKRHFATLERAVGSR